MWKIFNKDGAEKQSYGGGPRITRSPLSGGPPASPIHEDIWIATQVAGAANPLKGDCWMFQYDETWSTDACKWKFLGGAPIVLKDDNNVTSNTSAYAVPADGTGTRVATQFIAVRFGIYTALHLGTANGPTAASMNVGMLCAGTGQNLTLLYTNASEYRPFSGQSAPAAIGPGSSLEPQYAISTGTVTIANRQLIVTPLRIS